MENEVYKKSEISKKRGAPHNFNMGGTYYPDIQRSLYDQGVPDRSRWVQEAGKNSVLSEIEKIWASKTNKKYHYSFSLSYFHVFHASFIILIYV